MLESIQGLFSAVFPQLPAPTRPVNVFTFPDDSTLPRWTSVTRHEVPVKVLIIPADGTPPTLTSLITVDISSDGNVDRFLHHVPDMRSFWGSRDGWNQRDIARVDIKDHHVPSLNGCYFGFKSFALDHLPTNKHSQGGIYGDACIVKMAPEKYCSRGSRIVRINNSEYVDIRNQFARYAVYDDLSEEVVETGLWKEIVTMLSKV